MKLPTWLSWIGVNFFFALCHPALGDLAATLPPAARALLVNAALFVVPAAGWRGFAARSTRALGMRLAFTVAISTLVFLFCLVAIRLLRLPLTAPTAWTAIWLASNLGFLTTFARPQAVHRPSLPRKEIAMGTLLFFGAYALYYIGATRVVPPQVDHDLEVHATGFGLLTRFEPLLLTDRGGIYYFAHPPLLHFVVGGSFLLHGTFRDLEYYDVATRRARATRAGLPIAPLSGTLRLKGRGEVLRIAGTEGTNYVLVPEGGGPEQRVPMEDGELARIYMRYGERPHPLETRTPNLFFASAAVALLGLWIGRISRRWWFGLLAAAAYACSPEIFVRASYGGYFAIGSFATILMLLAVEQWRRPAARRSTGIPLLVGAFAALADHKLILLPAAIGIRTVTQWWQRRRQQLPATLFEPTVIGFALGGVLFWCYGLAIAPAAFLQDHLHHHLLDRLTHQNPLGYQGYATPVGLWVELARHSAYVLVPAGTALLLHDLYRRRSQLLPRDLLAKQLWFLWILLTAVTFTITDWRMTKHVVLLLLPLHLALAPERAAPRWRVALPVAVLFFVLAYNLWMLEQLARDFSALSVTPAW